MRKGREIVDWKSTYSVIRRYEEVEKAYEKSPSKTVHDLGAAQRIAFSVGIVV